MKKFFIETLLNFLKRYFKEPPKTFWGKVIDSLIYFIGTFLIVFGCALLIWLSFPYVNLVLRSPQKKVLEEKARLGDVEGNRVIIPSILVNAPLLEYMSKETLSLGVCFDKDSARPGEDNNVVIQGHNLGEFGLFKPRGYFSLLELLRKEDKVYLFYKGKRYVYEVTEKNYLDKSNPRIYEKRKEKLTLVTCVSTFSLDIYTNRRTVITAKPIEKPVSSTQEKIGREKL